VRWYDERILFLNPGGLTPPLTLERLKREHPSNPRNRKIAEMFFYAGLIEQWGRGIRKMLDECAAAGLPEPDFEEDMGFLWLTFRKDILTEEQLRSLGLNERQIKAVLYAKEKGKITNREYREVNDDSNKTAYLELTDLVQRGILVQEGTGKSLRYMLPKSNAKVTKR
jgi:ATP-dependent DNA helicase RecG